MSPQHSLRWPDGSSAACSFSGGGSVLIYDIDAPENSGAKYTVHGLCTDLLGCYNKARIVTPSLRGKVTLSILISEGGAILSVDAQSTSQGNDPRLVSCVNDVMKASAHFPRPGGTATVHTMLVFRP